MLDDKIEEATTLLERDFSANLGQSYLPLGNLFIERKNASKATEYIRTLDFEKGMVEVSYIDGGIHFNREYFVSYPDNCLLVRLTSDKACDYIISADSQLKYSVTAENNKLYLCGECPTSLAPGYAIGSVPTVYDGDGIKFAAIGHVSTDGNVSSDGSSLSVESASFIELYLCIETSYISFDVLPEKEYYYPCEEHTKLIAKKAYEQIKSDHCKDFSFNYNKVKTDFGFKPSELATSDRLSLENKIDDLGLVELLFNFGRYLVIASSRNGSQATNLQGIWNERFYAPWSSNYTVNINTEMNYWPVLMCGLAGFDLPLIDLVKKISVTGHDAAQDFYGAEGYCSHHNIDLWGLATPVGAQKSGCLGFAYWNMSSGWLCRHVYEHYEYTLDREYLEKTAYPLMRGAAEFYLSVMSADGDKLVICPSTSPENSYYHTENSCVSIARYTTMTQAILMDLFGNILKAAEILGVEDEFVERIRNALPKLNTYKVGSEGQLLEYDKEYKENDIHHRHVSHLYGLYPGESITADATPELAEACKTTLERRGDVSTGWSMGWKVNLWTKLKDGDHALHLIENQLQHITPGSEISWQTGGTYSNMFDAHPPFQIDGNFGVCAGIAQMFLQCEDGKIKILPALPKDFQNGHINGLVAKGGVVCDIAWQNGELSSCTLVSPVTQTVTVHTREFEKVISLSAGVPEKVK